MRFSAASKYFRAEGDIVGAAADVDRFVDETVNVADNGIVGVADDDLMGATDETTVGVADRDVVGGADNEGTVGDE